MSGGGGSSSDGGSGASGSNKAAFTSNAAYSGSTKPSEPPGGGSTPLGSGRDHSFESQHGDKITRISSGQEPGYRPQDSRPFGLSKEEAYRQGKITVDQRDAEPSITEQTERDITRDLTFSEHWNLAPESIKFSPALRFLYASGKNVGEWANKKGFKLGGTGPNDFSTGGGNNERNIMNTLAPEAPYIVSGITPPASSPASNWYANLGTTNTNQHATSIATQYAAAKTAVSKTLQNKGAIGMLAVNQSPFYDWLKTNKIDKGIL